MNREEKLNWMACWAANHASAGNAAYLDVVVAPLAIAAG